MRILLLTGVIFYQLIYLPTVLAAGVFGESEPPTKVLTATRLQQSPTEVPGSLTVLDRELIKASTARSIPELLRLVPGMQVVAQNGYTSSVNYHAGDPQHSRRIQVLIDGQSVLNATLTTVNWNDLPIAIDDIERIEVFRGPNTVSYGTNALLGVINIITRPARYSHSTHLKVNTGANGVSDWYINTGNSWSTGGSWLSLSGRSDNGFSKNINLPLHTSFKSGNDHTNFRWQGDQELSEDQKISWYLAGNKGINYASNTYGPLLTMYPEEWSQARHNVDSNANYKNQNYSAGLHWSFDISDQHLLEAKTAITYYDSKRKWNTCDLSMLYTDPDLWLSVEYFDQLFNPEYYVCGELQENINEKRIDIELQDTYTLNSKFRTTQGFRFRKDFVRSNTFFHDKPVNKYVGSIFWQGEWQATNHWLLQSGFMLEDDNIVGHSYTPRLAINYLFSPSHSLRAVYTEATRSPDLLDLKANWQYHMKYNKIVGSTGPSGNKYFLNFTGNPKLKQERTRSFEFGYHGIFDNPSLTIDAKIFHDKISNMISQAPEIENFDAANNYSLTLLGYEIEADWQINSNNRLRTTYTNLKNKLNYKQYNEITDGLENLTSSRHTASIVWLKQWPRDWNTSLMYFYSSKINYKQYRQTQARIGKSIPFKEATVELSLNWRYIFDQPVINPNNLPINFYKMRYRSNSQLYFSAEVEF